MSLSSATGTVAEPGRGSAAAFGAFFEELIVELINTCIIVEWNGIEQHIVAI
jgi:hypothetical protein